ncbi:MAG: PilZ domain-containing protein [Myxococcaceae bacterium]
MSDTLVSFPSTQDPKAPVRLKVAYKTPAGLLSEFTRSVGRGGVALESRRQVAVGTRFVFELRAQGVSEIVEVLGEVVQVAPVPKGKFRLDIRYDRGADRKGLDALIQAIFDSHKYEKVRKFPRIPLNLRATEDTAYSPSYVIRDVSTGGAGVEVEAPAIPRSVRVGVPFLLELSISLGTLALHGEVVWVFSPPTERAKWINPTFGVAFGKLRPDTRERLDRILVLQGLPPPPWKARVSFGMEAVSRMP